MSDHTKNIWLVVAAVHLSLVLAGALSLHFPFAHVENLWRVYGAWSGANSGYAFFAPGLGSQLRVTFEVHGPGSTVVEETVDPFPSNERELLVGNIIDFFWKGTDRKVQRSLVASWAGKVLGRHPHADKVVVRLDSYHLPDMKNYSEGVLPRWAPAYSASFVRRAK